MEMVSNNILIISQLTYPIIGTCQPDEFAKALEKIGLIIPTKRELDMLFQYYDSDASGALDYKEFTAILVGGDKLSDPN